MPLNIVRNNIVNMQVDAIVNSANPEPKYDQGTDLAIYRAAGIDELLAERKKIGNIARGEVAYTPAFNLKAKYIFHTVGPVWELGEAEEFRLLRSCYKNCLNLAKKLGCESIAFPLISTGIYGFPKSEALKLAIAEISDFLIEDEMMITLVVYDDKAFELSGRIFDNVEDYLSANGINTDDVDNYIGANIDNRKYFRDMLFEYLDQRQLTNKEAYTRSNLDRKLFSKIQCSDTYHPSKNTVLALCIGLQLNMEEAEAFMARADFAFNPTSVTDLIVKCFILSGEYDIAKVNMALFAHHEETLGV